MKSGPLRFDDRGERITPPSLRWVSRAIVAILAIAFVLVLIRILSTDHFAITELFLSLMAIAILVIIAIAGRLPSRPRHLIEWHDARSPLGRMVYGLTLAFAALVVLVALATLAAHLIGE